MPTDNRHKPLFPACTPPQQVVCVATSEGGPVLCSCATVPPPPRECTVTITYRSDVPNQPIAVLDTGVCDQAGAELAIAVMLARLLGGRL